MENSSLKNEENFFLLMAALFHFFLIFTQSLTKEQRRYCCLQLSTMHNLNSFAEKRQSFEFQIKCCGLQSEMFRLFAPSSHSHCRAINFYVVITEKQFEFSQELQTRLLMLLFTPMSTAKF